MKTQFLNGFLAALPVSLFCSPLLYEMLLELAPGQWGWLLGLPLLGYWLGQRPRSPYGCGLVCGWVTPAMWVLPDLGYIARRLGTYGGCGTGLHWAEIEATALLFCIPAALGQLRCYLRKTSIRLPE